MGSKRSGTPRYTRQVHTEIVRHVRAGAFKAHAAQYAGISVDALERWLALGRAFNDGSGGDRRYAKFAIDVDRAIAEDAMRLQSVLTRAALGPIPGDWRASLANLERKHPRLYGRAAMQAAIGVTIGDSEDDEAPQRTKIQFYLPDNGRRPDSFEPVD